MQYYGGYYYNYYPNEILLRQRAEKNELSRIGIFVGAAVLLHVLFQQIVLLAAYVEEIAYAYTANAVFPYLFSIIVSILSIFVPFMIMGFAIRKKTGREFMCYGKPKSVPLTVTVIFFGFFICLASNFITNIFVSYLEAFGIELSSPDVETPQGVTARIIYAVAVAVVPALVEEFAFRGVIMQPLRKYGDTFAIVSTAVIFGIIHGNLIQAPFAFIAGLGMGYAVCITESIWTGVIIHFLNNFYSVLMSFLVSDIKDEELLNRIYIIIMVALYSVTIIGSVVFLIVKKKRKLAPSSSILTGTEKTTAFFLNPTMIIAFIIMLVSIIGYIALPE